MTNTTTEKLFHQLHHCMNLLRRGHGRGHGGHHEGRGECGSHHRGQGRIISLLRARDGISQKELAELLNIRPPSLSEVLDKLEANGLIERRQHEDDKRVSNVFITEKGSETAVRVEEARQSMADELLAGLSPQEQESLSELLGKLTGALEAKLGDAEEGGRHGGHCCHGRHGERHHDEERGHGHEHGRHHHHAHGGHDGRGHGCHGEGHGHEHGHGRGHGEGCCHGHKRDPQKENKE